MPTGSDYQRMLLAQALGSGANPVRPTQPAGFNFLEDDSLRGFLGGIGREGPGLIGQGFGALFGSGPNNVVNLGGGNQFIPGQGFLQQAFGPPTAGGQFPTTGGFDISSFLGSLFGG